MKKVFSVLIACCLFFTSSIAASAAFKDVGNTYWAKDEITYLTGKKVINGFYDASFRPQAPVTRIQAMILLANALKLDLSNRPNPGFKDLSAMSSGYKHTAAIMDEGLFPKSTYLKPNEPMTRQLMARMIASAFKLKASKNMSFKDVPSSHWARPYISALAEHNITVGYPDGTFKPDATLTRAQFSVFLAKALSDDFKTFTLYSNSFNYQLELPNYMKTQVTVEEEKKKDGVLSTHFYYNNTTHLGFEPYLASIHIIPASKWDFYKSAPYNLIKKYNNYYYCYQSVGEHPYYEYNQLGSREAKTFERIQYRLTNAIYSFKPKN